MGVEPAALAGTLDAHNRAAAAAAADAADAAAAAAVGRRGGGAGGGAGVVTPRAGGYDTTGKRYFPAGDVDPASPMWVARVTPVTHYTMGGLAIGPGAEVLGPGGAPLPGVWAAGEAAGGLHGANRLGG